MQRLSSSLATKALRPARTGDQQPDNHIETQFTRTNPVSFAPAFFSVGKRHLGPINEPIGDIDATPLLPEVSVVMSPSSSSRAVGAWQRQPQQTAAFSPVPSKKSKSAVGPLAKRLKSLRDGIKGDSIRFSSGQYPFSIRSVNRNDPRNRADSVCNVTILGSLFPWDNQVRGELSSTHQQSQLRLMTALSYVHNWTSPTAGTLRTEQLDIDKEQGEIGVAWIVFSYDTAREHNLTAGSQIRVYNAVSIPFAPSVLRANDVTGSNADEMKVNVSINRIVLCSQLCEIYPSAILPPLPDVSSVWVSLQATQSPRT